MEKVIFKILLVTFCVILLYTFIVNSRVQSENLASIDFESVTIDINPFWNMQAEHIEINANGTYENRNGNSLYIIKESSQGNNVPKPSARFVFNLNREQILQLQDLLKKTKWLTAEGGEGPALHTDAGTYTIHLKRNGSERSVLCNGERPEPYKSLIWFFRGVAHQQNLLYRLTFLRQADNLEACRDISDEIEALSGEPKMYPLWDLDYSYYQEHFMRVISKPYSHSKEEIITAIKLLAYLKAEAARGYIEKLAYDLDSSVRRAVARALGDFKNPESIPVLAEMVESTDEARWSLIRMGPQAVPTIIKMIEDVNHSEGSASEWLVRTYIEHWNELPGPLETRIIEAAEKKVNQIRLSARTKYYEGFIVLARNNSIPSSQVLCTYDGRRIKCFEPLQFIHGWYVVEDGRITKSGAGPSPESGTELFRLLEFKTNIEGNSLNIQTGWQPMRGKYGGYNPEPVITESKIAIPDGAELIVTDVYRQKHRLANETNPVRIDKEFRVIREIAVLKNGNLIKIIVYIARIAEKNSGEQKFKPPAKPLPVFGKLPDSRPKLSFSDMELIENTPISDSAFLHDIAVTWINEQI